ncbi:hypothetical protein FSC37_18105 [Piscinibacter aquaticus]|uniref:Uncharacterized protein n=1 Tax=Piscinibacter aquaticus TaxID=392597 RepID=A0A5C6U5D6_9BURK|nr:hypothetical protein FSC37_18105 [Piscinibacter aquaticus]
MHMPSTDVAPVVSTAPAAIIAPAAESEAPQLVCRCNGCGSVVAFDALIVSCRCADDDRPADSALH